MSKSRRTSEPPLPAPHAKALFARLFRSAWCYKPIFLASVLALMIYSATNNVFLALVKEIMDEGLVKKSAIGQAMLPLYLLALMLVRGLTGFASNYGIRVVARRVVEDYRKAMFNKLMQLPIAYFDARSVGTLVSKFTFDVERLANVTTRAWMNALRDVFLVLSLIAYMLYLDWRLTLVFAAIMPLAGVYLTKITPKLKKRATETQQSVGEMTKVAEEAIAGQRIVKIFGAQVFEFERFSKIVGNNRQLELKVARISGLSSFVVELFSALTLSLVIYYAMGNFTAGEFAAFIGALLMLIAPIKHLAAANEEFQVGLAAAQSIFEVIDTDQELDDGTLTLARARGDIELKNVSLRYPDAKENALNNLSFSIKAGEKIALVGRSGGGKSTLVNLLPRFYEAEQGVILLDGVDIHALQLTNLRAQFALVSQDIVLFNDTIYNNIAYGVLRDVTEAEVITAAKAAHAWEFIQKMPNGLQSEIGDRGVKLSGGQRQRLAIARAILKNAPILLLDEATSALDTESEQHVQAALDTLMQDRTTIVIAHRLSTIENADRIFVMEQGAILETGAHAQLMQQNGHYAKLYHKQFS